MSTTTKRLLVGSALAGVAVLAVGAPALAATHSSHRAVQQAHVTHPVVSTTAPATVEIGTAVQYVRNADGTISSVTPH